LASPGGHELVQADGELPFRMGTREELQIADNGDGYFRLSFSTATKEEMKQAARIFARITKEFFETELL
jgi:DNA-binding transcriptional MocR family regulator